MTTVAYRNGVIAADSLGVTGYSTRAPGLHQKIWRLADGTLLGGCGDLAALVSVVADAQNISELKKLESYTGSELLCVCPADKSILHNARGSISEIRDAEFFAIGSGAAAALGAMANGASAEEAIRAAALIDLFTDDRVQKLEFGGPPSMPKMTRADQTPAEPAVKPQRFGFWKIFAACSAWAELTATIAIGANKLGGLG